MASKRPIVLGPQGAFELLQPGDSLVGVPSGPQGTQGSQGSQGVQGYQGSLGPTFGNIDGGTWNTVYGGTTPVDGGTF